MIQCVVVDDEPLAIDILEDYIRKTPFLTLAASFTDPLEALEHVNRNDVGLIFLDIQMPDITGIQSISLVKEKVPVILTTAYKEFALEGYEYNVTDYLLKPIAFERFLKAVQRVIDQPVAAHLVPVLSRSDPGFIFIKTDTRLIRVMLQDILYIEGKRDYVIIVTAKEKIITLQNMKKMEEDLPGGQFVRVHKSFIVALSKIRAIEHRQIFIHDTVIPVGNTYQKHFFDVVAGRKLS